MPAILKDVRELAKDDPRITLALEEGQMDSYEVNKKLKYIHLI